MMHASDCELIVNFGCGVHVMKLPESFVHHYGSEWGFDGWLGTRTIPSEKESLINLPQIHACEF